MKLKKNLVRFAGVLILCASALCAEAGAQQELSNAMPVLCQVARPSLQATRRVPSARGISSRPISIPQEPSHDYSS